MSTRIEGFNNVSHLQPGKAAGREQVDNERDREIGATARAESVRLTDKAVDMYVFERSLLDGDGIDMERVREISNAIAERRYQVDPQAIAAGMLAMDKALFG